MKRDPYEVLGVERTALAETIRLAYRQLAQQLHPDKGGDEEAFKELGEAYILLANPEARAHYDAHGHGPTLAQEAASVLDNLMGQYLRSTDLRDPLTSLTEALTAQRQAQKASLAELNGRLNRVERYLKGLKPKQKGATLLADIMKRQQAALTAERDVVDHAVAVCSAVLDLLGEWELPREAPNRPAGMYGATSATSWGGV